MPVICSHCGKAGFPPTYRACPYCGYPLTMASTRPMEERVDNYIKNNTTMPIFGKTEGSYQGLEIVKGTVMWSLNPGEIARRINVNEFDSLSGAKGVYVQEGVVAVLMIDGQIAAQLSSGVYYFQTGFERFGEAIRNIWRFFTGKKQNGSANDDELRRGRLGSYLQNLGKSSLVDVILVTEGVIPIVFGIESNESGFIFKPFTIKTKLENVEVAISMHMEVSDFSAFRKNYLTKRPFYRIADLQLLLVDPIRNYLQEALAYETVESSVLSPSLKERVRRGLSEKLNTVLYGISVRQIIDISIDSNDFDRFRELEHKLYCSNKELEYLIRTNDFKNRLASEENSQKIREARSEEDLRYALQQLNKDALLHDDEMEEFCQLLANQKAIREARTDEDREKALQEIRKSTLIREDEFEDLQYELKKHHDDRAEVDLILHWQRFRRTEKERISAEKDIALLTADSQKAIEQAEFEITKQKQAHDHEIGRTDIAFKVEVNDVLRGEQKKDDDYSDSRRDAGHIRDISEDRDWTDNVHYEETLAIERLREKQNLALDAMARKRAEDRADRAQTIAHSEKMAQMDHETQRILFEAQKGMSAEQIAAMNLDGLSEAAQIALATTLSSSKEGEYLKMVAEEKVAMIKELVEQTRGIEKESRDQQERTLNKMMAFMAEALKTNASVVTGAVVGQREAVENTLNTVKDIATHRQDEVDSDRRKAENDAKHAQSRLDHTQDTALHYTTKFASTESIAEAVKGKEDLGNIILTYKIMSMGDMCFGLGDIFTMMQHGQVGPDTELMINGQIFKAYDRPELKGRLDEIFSVDCPNCGATGLKGHLCPECKKLL